MTIDILTNVTPSTMEPTAEDHAAVAALNSNSDKFAPLVTIALAANVIACAGGNYSESTEDAIWAATPALSSLDAKDAATVKWGVEYVNCQQDPAAALHELVRDSLETLLAEPGVAA